MIAETVFGSVHMLKERPLDQYDFLTLFGVIRGLDATGADRVTWALQYAYTRLKYLEEQESKRQDERTRIEPNNEQA